MRRFAGRPAVFLLSRALATGDFAGVRGLLRRALAVPGRRTLDLGCGPGTFADLFAGEDYVGVDPDRRHVEYARRARPGTFLAGELGRLDLPDRRFDQAFSCGVLEHLGDRPARAVLAEARRVLVPGGRLLVVAELPPRGRLDRLRQALLGPVTRGAEGWRRLIGELAVVERIEPFSSGPTRFVGVQARTGNGPNPV